jgi:hypothetical protein
MVITAKGILAHHFHGAYWAQIALEFETEENARDCLPVLGSGWEVGQKHKNILVWTGDSAALDETTKILVSFGAEEKKIASCATSIDHGEWFKITCDVRAVVKEQTSLFEDIEETAHTD